MTANCDIYELDTPLSKLSYDEEFGYYDSSTGQMIKPYIMRSYDWVNQCVNNYKNGITTGNPNVSYCPL